MPFVTDYLWQLCSNFLSCHKRLFVAKYQHIVANLVATKTKFSCSVTTDPNRDCTFEPKPVLYIGKSFLYFSIEYVLKLTCLIKISIKMSSSN